MQRLNEDEENLVLFDVKPIQALHPTIDGSESEMTRIYPKVRRQLSRSNSVFLFSVKKGGNNLLREGLEKEN